MGLGLNLEAPVADVEVGQGSNLEPAVAELGLAGHLAVAVRRRFRRLFPSLYFDELQGPHFLDGAG